ncbi:MAG: TIGR01777 family protein, partial [Candidatus Dadabacteria bacterium]
RARVVLPAGAEVAEWHAGGRLDAAAVAGSAAVVHLAGAGIADARWSKQRKLEILRSRTEPLRALLRAAQELPPSERPSVLVSASAVGVYGDRGDELLDETSEPGRGFLAEVCRQWEAAALEGGAAGLRVVILRFGLVLDPSGGALGRLLPVFRLGLGGRLGSGRQWLSWIHVGDLAAMIRWALETADLCGVVNAVAPEPVRNADFTRVLAAAVGRPAFLHVPRWVLKLVLGELATALLASQRVRPAVAERLGFKFAYPRLDRALEDLLGRPG